MSDAILSILIAAGGLALSIGASVYVTGRRQGSRDTDITYIRRDLDQILKLYRLTPIAEQERKRRR